MANGLTFVVKIECSKHKFFSQVMNGLCPYVLFHTKTYTNGFPLNG